MMSMSNICTCQQGFSMLTELTSHMWATFYKFLLIKKTCECHFLDLDKLCQIVFVTNLYLWPKWIQHILAGWLVDNLPDFNNLQYIINIWWWCWWCCDDDDDVVMGGKYFNQKTSIKVSAPHYFPQCFWWFENINISRNQWSSLFTDWSPTYLSG